MELRDMLLFLSTAGAALAAYWLLNDVGFLRDLSPKQKRWAAVTLTAAIALAAWGTQVAMLYAPQPANWREWVERGFGIAGAAVGLNQLIHGRDLRKQPPPTIS